MWLRAHRSMVIFMFCTLLLLVSCRVCPSKARCESDPTTPLCPPKQKREVGQSCGGACDEEGYCAHGLRCVGQIIRRHHPAQPGHCASQVKSCNETDEKMPVPSQVSTLQKEQIQKSLSLQGHYTSPKTSFDAVFQVSSWQGFANNIGFQYFSANFLRDEAGNEYVHFNYAIDGNSFGSVHPCGSADPVISIDGGDWAGLGTTPSLLVKCLEDAGGGDGLDAGVKDSIIV